MKDSQGSADTKSSTHEPCGDQQIIPSDAPAVDSGSVSDSGNKNKKVTREDIEVVQNLIERCLQLYMNKDEVVHTLLHRARIEPGFTTLVWQKLEEENADFFKAYHVRLKLKRQIIVFNQLLEHQFHMMRYPAAAKGPLSMVQNGVHHMPVHSLPMGYPVLQQPPMPSMGHPPVDARGSLSSCHIVSGIPAPVNFQSMQINTMNGTMAATEPAGPITDIKSEMSVSSTPAETHDQFSFHSSDVSGMIMDASAMDPTFTADISQSDHLQLGQDNGADEDSKESLHSLGHISWNFSVSDLMAELSNMEDPETMRNYSMPSEDMMLDSPDQNDLVEEFFADTVPGPSSQSEEEQP